MPRAKDGEVELQGIKREEKPSNPDQEIAPQPKKRQWKKKIERGVGALPVFDDQKPPTRGFQQPKRTTVATRGRYKGLPAKYPKDPTEAKHDQKSISEAKLVEPAEEPAEHALHASLIEANTGSVINDGGQRRSFRIAGKRS